MPAQPLRLEAADPAPFPDPATILVGIPALNEERHIAACLRSLVEGAPAMRSVRIVVADGGSTDATRAILDSLRPGLPNLVVIDNPDRLQSAAMNRIVATCATPEHRILVRCDAHACYPRGYVLDVAASLFSRDAAAVAATMDATGATPFQRAAAWIVDTPLGSGGAPHRGGRSSAWVDHGHHAGIRLDWFRRLGGYDPGFSHNEDAEFDRRLTRAGGRIWLDAGLRLDYPMRDSLPALARQYWCYGRGRAAHRPQAPPAPAPAPAPAGREPARARRLPRPRPGPAAGDALALGLPRAPRRSEPRHRAPPPHRVRPLGRPRPRRNAPRLARRLPPRARRRTDRYQATSCAFASNSARV